jgi:hypothetical protein
MPRFTIPEQYADGLAALRRLPDNVVQNFVAALSTVPPSLNKATLVTSISSSVASVSQGEIEEMVVTVISLYRALDSSDSSTDLFVEGICDAMADSKRKDLTFDGLSDRARFKARLTELLDIDSFGVASKALSLKNECDHLFCVGRILTDARPVYSDDVSAPPRAALILHTLRLAYHKTNDLKEFYITFDDSDLKELRELLDRADLKSKSLAVTLKAAGINVITTE